MHFRGLGPVSTLAGAALDQDISAQPMLAKVLREEANGYD